MGDKKIYNTLGASNHSDEDRAENDFYATPKRVTQMLLDKEKFNNNVLEPCCGIGHISEVLIENNYTVTSFDLIDRGYGEGNIDFFKYDKKFDGDIVTNPPYSQALKFLQHGLNLIDEGNKIAMFLRLQFFEGKSRYLFFKNNPPKVVYISVNRISPEKNGVFVSDKHQGAVCFAWFVWKKGFKGETVIKYFNEK